MYIHLVDVNKDRKTRLEVANSGKTMTFCERSEFFRKYPKAPVFDHSNYRLFERIPAVPGTSNNRGLTVWSISKREYKFEIMSIVHSL